MKDLFVCVSVIARSSSRMTEPRDEVQCILHLAMPTLSLVPLIVVDSTVCVPFTQGCVLHTVVRSHDERMWVLPFQCLHIF